MVYAMQILMSLMMVTFVFVLIMIAEASTDRIEEVLKEVPEMQDKEDAVKEVPDGSIIYIHCPNAYVRRKRMDIRWQIYRFGLKSG